MPKFESKKLDTAFTNVFYESPLTKVDLMRPSALWSRSTGRQFLAHWDWVLICAPPNPCQPGPATTTTEPVDGQTKGDLAVMLTALTELIPGSLNQVAKNLAGPGVGPYKSGSICSI